MTVREIRNSVIRLLFLLLCVLYLFVALKSHQWGTAVAWAVPAMLLTWNTYSYWPKSKEEETLDKSQELKDRWKNDL
jgi:hypothetical protein